MLVDLGTGPFGERNRDIIPDGKPLIGSVRADDASTAGQGATLHVQAVIGWFVVLQARPCAKP